jgi:hypothetical protein
MGEGDNALMLSPDLFRGLASFLAQAPPGPGTRPGKVEGVGREGTNAATSTVTLTKVRAQFMRRGDGDLALIPHIAGIRPERT